jgi:signal transduction histidine kinase
MKFKYNPRILEQLGTELITSDEVAFTELLKNSYDARASKVRVHFLDSVSQLDESVLLTPLNPKIRSEVELVMGNQKLIIIEDNGSGMDKDRLDKGFFTVGSTLKEQMKKTAERAGSKEKITLGDKGLGRLSSQRLASTMIVETSDIKEKYIHFVEIKWSEFFNDLQREAPEKDFLKDNDISYTRLWFAGDVDFSNFIDDRRTKQPAFFEEETDDEIFLQEKLQSSVSFLYSPFDEAQEDFQIEFYWNNKKIRSAFHNDSINIAETIHSFKLSNKTNPTLNLQLTLRPWYVEMIHLRVLGKNLFTERRQSPEFYSSLLDKYKDRLDANLIKEYSLEKYLKEKDNTNLFNISNLESILPIEGKVFSFHREPFRFGLALNSAKVTGSIDKGLNMGSIREFLNYHNGIKLYRDKFRIANLGDKESDWLNLQQARTKGQQFFRFELGNVIGYVKINDFYQNYIKEISSRQELKQTPHASALKSFLQSIFNNDFYQLSTTAYYLVRDILDEEGLIPKNSPLELKKQVDESEALLKETLKSLDTFHKSFDEIRENIALDNPEKIKKVQKIIQSLDNQEATLSSSIDSSISTLKTAKNTLTLIEERQKESYNNYKLMANGLITEVMTHELHSILVNAKSGIDYHKYIEALKQYLLEVQRIDLYKDNLKPLGERMDFLHTRVNDLDNFYNFLEKTFIRQGTHDDFENENFAGLISGFQKRLDKRLRSLKTDLIYNNLEGYYWYVPKGTLTHVFYNLIDNSLHWIGERQKRSHYEQQYKISGRDFIKIEKIDPTTIHYYDSGTGVIEEMQYTLFHPFQTGKKNGRGMGLYIVKNLLESFGGHIELLPERNVYGNRYVFSLSTNPDEYEQIPDTD